MKNKNVKVSIILRSFNEERWISACLKSIYSQDFKDFEVILVDNKSTDKTVEKAQQFPVKIVTIDKFYPGEAINIGIRASVGELLVCLSAHCIPVNNCWLGNLVKNFNDPKLAGVYGRQEPMSFTSDTDKRDLITIFGLDRKVQFKDSFFHNANSMFRRDIWEKIPFDERISNIEDRVWAKEVLKAGFHLVYDPEASVYHYHGIHQNQNMERCKNVVKILENLNKQDNKTVSSYELEKLNCVALIPVRGNVLKLNNQFLLKYTIDQAKKSKYLKKVIVLTDTEEHARIAKECGAEVPFLRDASLSEDYIGLEEVYRYSINELEKREIYPDIVVPLEITFPFRDPKLIDELIIQLWRDGFDSVIAAKQEYASCWSSKNGQIERIDEGLIPRKFKQPTLVGIEGLGCATLPIFLREGRLIGENVGIYQISDKFASIEVRDEASSKFAESIFANWKGHY